MNESIYLVRNYHNSDFDEYVRLQEEAEHHDRVGRCLGRRFLLEQLHRPGFVPEEHLLVAAGSQRLLAYIDITLEEGVSRVVLDCLVHPAHRRMGLGTRLFNHALDFARKLEIGWAQANVADTNHGARMFLENLDFTPVRVYLDMLLGPGSEVSVLGDTVNITLQHLQPGQEEVLMQVQNCAFQESWGYNPNTVMTISRRLEMSDTSPEHVILAVSGAEVMGYCWTTEVTEEIADKKGRIYMLGVCPRFRDKGLGRHLLLAGLRYLNKRGVKSVELTVDSQNTSARRLYDSAGFKIVSASLWFERDLRGDGVPTPANHSPGR